MWPTDKAAKVMVNAILKRISGLRFQTRPTENFSLDAKRLVPKLGGETLVSKRSKTQNKKEIGRDLPVNH